MYYSSKEIIVVRIILRLDTVVNHKKNIFGLGAGELFISWCF